jgi:nucleotide-binding universal stress UspA family protein
MTEVRRILCPVDFSEFSRHALDHAAALAGWYDAQLTVLYVFPIMPVMDVPPPTLAEEDRARLVTQLRDFAANLGTHARPDFLVCEAPSIVTGILAQVPALGADLLVLGSHGRSGFSRALLGSVTEKVIRHAPCPALVVPRRAPDRPPDGPVRFGRILCPIDFSEASIYALEHAIALAEEADAELTLLHVVEVPPELNAFPLATNVDIGALRAMAEGKLLRRLRELIPEQATTYCTVEAAVHEGAAYHEILRVAAERHVDLIVMGVHGRGALDLMVFGSNAARVVRRATCPVLIVGSMSGQADSVLGATTRPRHVCASGAAPDA